MTFDTRTQYAVATADNGNFEHARSMVIDLIAEDWNNAEAHRAWGAVLLKEGKSTDAVAAYRVSLGLNPESADVYFELAEALLLERHSFAYIPLPNWSEAQASIEKGLRISPAHPVGLQLKAKLEQSRERLAR